MEAQQQTQTFNPPDGAGILEITNPSKEVDRLMLTFLGLGFSQSKKDGKKVVRIFRNNKPTFTDEFVRNLIKDILQFVNYTTQVSRSTDKRIKRHVGNYLVALSRSLAAQGDDNYISDNTWSKILEIHHAKFEDEDGNMQNGWLRFGVEWDYDQPVRFEMLKYNVKDFTEEVDQAMDFKRIIRSLAPFLEASLSKSFSGENDAMGMTVSALGQIRSETQTITGEKAKKRGSLFKTDSDEESSRW